MKLMNKTSVTSQNVRQPDGFVTKFKKKLNLFNISQFHLLVRLLTDLPISLSEKKSCLLCSPCFGNCEILPETFDLEPSLLLSESLMVQIVVFFENKNPPTVLMALILFFV